MKAEHRHELKTNELVEWIQNLPQWFNENRITIIAVVVVVAVAAGLYIWKYYAKDVAADQKQVQFTNLTGQVAYGKRQVAAAQAEGKDLSFILLQPAENLKNLALNASSSEMAALALIKRAEALRAELHYRLGSVSSQEAASRIEQAKASYSQAIEKAPSNPSLVAAAKLGLGLCEEELDNFDAAAQIYRGIADDPNFQPTVACAAAKFRLETMNEYKQKLTFRPAPIPVIPLRPLAERLPIEFELPPEANRPTVTNVPADINRPVTDNAPVDTNRPVDVNSATTSPRTDVNQTPQSPNSVP
jgi:tetratricopeptide (TPR) repeat protein